MLKSLLTFALVVLLGVSTAYAGGNKKKYMAELTPMLQSYVFAHDWDDCVRYSCDYVYPVRMSGGYHPTLVQFDLGALNPNRTVRYELVIAANEIKRYGDGEVYVDGVLIDTFTMALDTPNYHLVEIPPITKDSKIVVKGVDGGAGSWSLREIVLRLYFYHH